MSDDISVTCASCGEIFLPSQKLQKMMLKFISHGRGLVMMECPSCHSEIAWKPLGTKRDVPFRCPISQCGGWVSQVDSFEDGEFWGCGECGSIWRKKETLMKEISLIQKKYEYRKHCYQKVGAEWVPTALESEFTGYQDLVKSEEPSASTKFERD
ncbi:hypothetical protein [Serratia liquefaciens]|jgi:predicted RNA-binding Zn-ribbon protein involved in translation (DUF1610 family)|uniref:hypothetical protein n=1 Tax=Serratia liquefaciens TaxID=614 RepID=UPI0011F1CB64|nr:hypothetical protein [Serratia liquefaciens]QIC89499.1 hypothetical protein F0336_24905 [Serratia liquefaciens]